MPTSTVRDVIRRNSWTLRANREEAKVAEMLNNNATVRTAIEKHPTVSKTTAYRLKADKEKRAFVIRKVSEAEAMEIRIRKENESKTKQDKEITRKGREAENTANFQAYKARKAKRANMKDLTIRNRVYTFSARTSDYGIRYGIIVVYGSHEACMTAAERYIRSIDGVMEILSIAKVTTKNIKKLSKPTVNMIPENYMSGIN